MAQSIFCHRCRKHLLIEPVEDRVYIYTICVSKNPGKKEAVIEKAISKKIYNPKQCPICGKKCIYEMKGGK